MSSSSSSIAPASSSIDQPTLTHTARSRSRSRSRDRSGNRIAATSTTSSSSSSTTMHLPISQSNNNPTPASSGGSARFARFSSIPMKRISSSETRKSNVHRAEVASSSASSLRTAHDIPPLRARAIPSSLISAKYCSGREGYLPIPLKPNQLRPTRKELQRFLKEIEHPLEYLDHPIRSQSVHDELHSIFLAATPLPNDLIGLIREYRLELQPSQSLLVSAKFGSHHGDSRPFNTAAIVTSSANVINEHNRFREEEEYLRTYTKEKLWNQMDRQRALEERHCLEFIGPKSSEEAVAVSVAAAAAIPKPTIIHSLPTLLYFGYSIREIVGYYGDERKLGPSCFGVKFVYGPQIEPAVDGTGECTMSEDDSLANRFDLGFVVSNALPKQCGYQRKHWRLHVDEYITRVTLHIGRWRFAVNLIFETNLNRKCEIGPMVYEGGETYACDAAAKYIIDTPPDHALIALTGSEGGHVHTIRGVYAAIKRSQKRHAETQQKEQHEHVHL